MGKSGEKKVPVGREIIESRQGKTPSEYTTWRKDIKRRKKKFDDAAKQTFLEVYSRTDRKMEAAAAAGVTYHTVMNHVESDPEFAEAFAEARQTYRDTILAHAYHLAVEGVDEPIIGGMDRNEVVAFRRVYATNILSKEMDRVEPDYRNKAGGIDFNINAGVLVVPAEMTPEEWTAKYGKKPPTIEGKVVD